MATSTRLAEGGVHTYLNPETIAAVDRQAERFGLSRAAWLRMTILNALRAADGDA